MDEEKKTDVASGQSKKIKKVEKCVLSVLLALVMAAIGFIAGWFGRWAALGKKKQALLWAIDTAQANYYKEINEDALYNRLYSAFNLDPYSCFYPSAEYKKVAQEREGNNRDAGFAIWEEEHSLQVYSVKAGSSAEAAHITAGMYFLKFGTSDQPSAMKTGTAEEYFSFVGSLAKGQTYYVLCGASEKESDATVYELQNGTAGSSDDAGLAIYRAYDPMQVYEVVGNSSADRAGLKRGMYILRFGTTENESEMQSGPYSAFESFIAKLTGDTFYIACSFDKTGATESKVYKIKMENYHASYCSYRDKTSSYKFTSENGGAPVFRKMEGELAEPIPELDEDTAYIALTGFTGNAATEFAQCLSQMKKNGRKNLILDLRGNGGGYMDVFVDVAACLLKDTGSGSQKVAYAKFRSGSVVSYSAAKSTYGEYFKADSRVSVLADEYTASASECLIGALVDYKTVAYEDIYLHYDVKTGTAHTYGKGVMQTHYEDSSGNVLKLTAAEIFWPKSDKSIHGKGVTVEDGAVSIETSLLPDADDTFLQEVIAKIGLKAPVAV